jgi:hypothetical protein
MSNRMIKWLRWMFLPVACIANWYVALLTGIVLLRVAESFCPAEKMVSGMCTADWYPPVETGIFYFCAALSAVLVVTTAFLIAPDARKLVTWLAFGIGTAVAEYLAIHTSAWPTAACAVAAGLIAVLLLTRFDSSRSSSSQAHPPDIWSTNIP